MTLLMMLPMAHCSLTRKANARQCELIQPLNCCHCCCC